MYVRTQRLGVKLNICPKKSVDFLGRGGAAECLSHGACGVAQDMQLVPTKPTALCSLQAESVIVGYYAFRRKRIPVRLYARMDDLNQLRILCGCAISA